jgi:osmoprotectant transport system permease protein
MSALDPRIADALARLPDYLGQHVIVSVTALLLGLAVSLPLAVLATRRASVRWPLLAFASLIQTIPGLALLALFYPLLLGLSMATEAMFGKGFSALGFLPAVLALALYSMLPVLRNTITGILGIDPAVNQAALGVGMTPRQSLWMVELPIALPVIMAGIRTSAVWVIGTATLSTPIGQTSLGNYIFAGLQTQNWVLVLFGCVSAAVLALVVDQLLALVESGVGARKRERIAAGAVGLFLVLAAALAPGLARPTATYIIGAKTFTEQFILAALIQDRLQGDGFSSARRDGLGSTVIFEALAAGEIDVYVDYSGTIWANHMRRTDARSREQVLTEVGEWLHKERGIRMLGGLGFENAYALAMTRKRADALGVRTIADLARHASQLSMGADYEFLDRPEWAALREAYGLRFRQQRQMDPTFMYGAVASGEVDVISAFSSDGRIARYDLVVLADPRQSIPPYDAILMLSPRRADDENIRRALAPLLNKIDVETMRAANLRADREQDKETPAQAAKWLWERISRR